MRMVGNDLLLFENLKKIDESQLRIPRKLEAKKFQKYISKFGTSNLLNG